MAATKASASSLKERVASRRDSLSAAERRVARYLATHPEEVAFASAGQLGALTKTSDATVIRTVKALGYAGLPALKRTLQEDIRDRLGPAGRLGRSIEAAGTEPEDVLARILAESIHLLEQAQRTIRPDNFAEAVRIIQSARETLVLGAGGLAMLGGYLTLRLVRMRRSARNASASGFLLADDLLRLGKEDALVVIAHQAVSPEIDVALDHAAEVGARVVLITDSLGEALTDRVAATISAPIGSSETFNVQATTMAVLHALGLAVAAQDREQAVAALTDMNRLRDSLRRGTRGQSGRRRRNGARPATPAT